MIERGILFSAPMVRALQGGIKTQTRRTVNGEMLGKLGDLQHVPERMADEAMRLSPYGRPGDRLWVRETFFAYGRWETRYNEKKKRAERCFIDMTTECGHVYRYAAGNPDVPTVSGRSMTPAWHMRPALFMPRAVSRILLEITGVRIERLQSIGEADARAEGVTVEEQHIIGPHAGESLPPSVRAYRALWESIHGAGSWDGNPWVWVVEFKRV